MPISTKSQPSDVRLIQNVLDMVANHATDENVTFLTGQYHKEENVIEIVGWYELEHDWVLVAQVFLDQNRHVCYQREGVQITEERSFPLGGARYGATYSVLISNGVNIPRYTWDKFIYNEKTYL
jgi:hypothetical protein